MEDPRVVWDVGAALGEGPVWVARDSALWFVDILGRHIHRLDPASGVRGSWDAPEPIGFLQPIAGGGFVAGLASGLHRFDPASGRFAGLAEVAPEQAGTRLNDAAVDPMGRLWFGTMDIKGRDAIGLIWRLGDNGRAVRSGGECPIVNGPAISPDGGTLYHVDTVARAIFAYRIAEDGQLVARRLFASIAPADGNPDGVSVDAEGCLWIGLFGGWRARRYSPDGRLLAEVRFPVANVTKIAFGGPDLHTAYATTARAGLDAAALEAQPLAGHLFAFAVETPGLRGHEVSRGIPRA